MPKDKKFVWSDTLGMMRDRFGQILAPGLGLLKLFEIEVTGPTRRYPCVCQVLTSWLRLSDVLKGLAPAGASCHQRSSPSHAPPSTSTATMQSLGEAEQKHSWRGQAPPRCSEMDGVASRDGLNLKGYECTSECVRMSFSGRQQLWAKPHRGGGGLHRR